MPNIHHVLDEPAIAHLRIMKDFLACLEVNQEQLAKRHLLHLGFSEGMLEQIKILHELTSYVVLIETLQKANALTFAQLLESADQKDDDVHWAHHPWGHVALLLAGMIDPNESEAARESVGAAFDGVIEKAKEEHAKQRSELLAKFKQNALQEGADRLIIKDCLNGLFDGLGDLSEEYFQRYQVLGCSINTLQNQIEDKSHLDLKISKQAWDQAEDACARIQLQLSLESMNEGNANDTKNPAARGSTSNKTELLQGAYKVDREHADQCRDAYNGIKESLSKQLDDLQCERDKARHQWEQAFDDAIRKNDLLTQVSVAFKQAKKAYELADKALLEAQKKHTSAFLEFTRSKRQYRSLAGIYDVRINIPDDVQSPKAGQEGIWV